jgi:hypothetical protein
MVDDYRRTVYRISRLFIIVVRITKTVTLADIDDEGFREALNSDMRDFEDAVQYVICTRSGCDALVTRNKVDFGDKPNVFDPAELIERLRQVRRR